MESHRAPKLLRHGLLSVLAASLVSACATASGGTTPTYFVSPTAAVAPTFVGVTSAHGGVLTAALYDLQGHMIGSQPAGTSSSPGQSVTGSNGIYTLLGGTLSRVNRVGTVTQVATDLPAGLLGPVISPDGNQFTYGVAAWDAAGTTATTDLYIDGVGQTHHRVATFTRSAAEGGGYLPFLWTMGGIFLGTEPRSPSSTSADPDSSEIVHRATVVTMDPGTHTLSAPVTAAGCRFADYDLASGAIACLETAPSGRVSAIDVNPGTPGVIRIEAPTNDALGELHFTPDGKQIAFTVAHLTNGVWIMDAYAVPHDGGSPHLLARDATIVDTLTDSAALAQLQPEVHGPIVALDVNSGGATTLVSGGDTASPTGPVGVVCE